MKTRKIPEMVDLFDRVRKCSFREFSDYMEMYAFQSFKAGLIEGEHEGITLDEDELFQILIDEGLPSDKANHIVDKILLRG